VFGQANLMAARPIEMTWVAMSPATLAVMAPGDAMALFQHSQMSLHVASDMAQQVCEFLGWQKILSVHPVSARVCAWLLWNASVVGTVAIHTHAELAWRLNTTRESVTRTLQRLQTDGILRREGEGWLIARPDKLKELAQGEARMA
jgi:CRP-like cAMP-binding protein